jgi:hypothetical protein
MAKTYTLDQAVRQIGGPSPRWLMEKLRSGQFPGRKIGKSWRLTDEDIADILDACKNDPQIAARPTGLTPRSQKHTTA